MIRQHRGLWLQRGRGTAALPQHFPVPGSGQSPLPGALSDSVPEMCQDWVASMLKPPGLSALLSWGCCSPKKQAKNSLSYPEVFFSLPRPH